jgi:23S rRNA (pseudouridine1915-N3)-methyltransferase
VAGESTRAPEVRPMQILIIAVGKIKEKYLQDGIAEYTKRLRPYVKLNILEIAESKRIGNPSSSQQELVKDEEGARILAAIPHDTQAIVLDPGGEWWSSENLAEHIRQSEISGRNNLCFIIGGDLGLSDMVFTKSNIRLSLSPMTFTHQMVRLILLEQIYRACKIKHGEPYHK